LVSEDIMNFHVSSNTNNVSGNSVESDSSNVNNNAAEDGSQHSCDDVIFTMEDLEKKEEEKKCAHTMIAKVDKDPIVPSSVQSVELAESLSVSHATVIDQREQHGINETSGRCFPKQFVRWFKMFHESAFCNVTFGIWSHFLFNVGCLCTSKWPFTHFLAVF